VGKNTVLIAALQARNSARVVFSGSLEFFSDEFFNAEVVGKDGKTVKVGNQAFAKAVTMWCFQETGVLRVDSINHHLAGESETPKFYTIYETVEFEVKIQEKTNGVWAPYDGKDVQDQSPTPRTDPDPDSHPGVCAPAASHPVRAVHQLRLPVLRLQLLHDVRGVRLRHRIPPLQGGGYRQEDSINRGEIWCNTC